MSDESGKQTLIEAGTTFKGSFASDCPIVVRGRVEGELSGPSLTVSSTGSVSGTVKVAKLCSEGELSGEYDADVVELSGSVKDNTVIRAKSLEVKLSSERSRMEIVFAEVALAVGDVPSKEESVAAAAAAMEMAPTAPMPVASEEPAAPVEAKSEESAAAEAKDDAREGKHAKNGRKGGARTSTFPPPAM